MCEGVEILDRVEGKYLTEKVMFEQTPDSLYK